MYVYVCLCVFIKYKLTHENILFENWDNVNFDKSLILYLKGLIN